MTRRSHALALNDAMALAVAQGRKTETRRPLKTLHEKWQTGDGVWFREAHALRGYGESETVIYRASTPAAELIRWRPSMFMRREHTRSQSTIKALNVERTRDISKAGAQREGFATADDFLETWQSVYPSLSLDDKVIVVRFKPVRARLVKRLGRVARTKWAQREAALLA